MKTVKQLSNVIEPYILKAMTLMRDEISDAIQYQIDRYYNEKFFHGTNIPDVYERTYEMKDALSKSVYPVVFSDGKFSFRVGFSDSYLDFQYKGGATGFEVLGWASEGSHGGMIGGNIYFWNDFISEIEKKYGSFQDMFKRKCKEVGLPIK